jgi:hypothetical protein
MVIADFTRTTHLIKYLSFPLFPNEMTLIRAHLPNWKLMFLSFSHSIFP